MASFTAVRVASISCFIILNAMDMITTALGFRLGYTEANYFMATVLQTFGETTMFAVKLLVVWIVVASMFLLSARYWRLWYGLHAVNAVLAMAVLSNLVAVLDG